MLRLVATALVIVLLAALAYALLTGSLLVVVSASMAPTIAPGDVVFVQPATGPVRVGQIITYERNGKLITHRVTAVEETGLRTRGDSSSQADPLLVPVEQVRGVVRARIPYLGWLVAFIRQPLGWALLVVLPAVVLLLLEARDVLVALRRRRRASRV